LDGLLIRARDLVLIQGVAGVALRGLQGLLVLGLGFAFELLALHVPLADDDALALLGAGPLLLEGHVAASLGPLARAAPAAAGPGLIPVAIALAAAVTVWAGRAVLAPAGAVALLALPVAAVLILVAELVLHVIEVGHLRFDLAKLLLHRLHLGKLLGGLVELLLGALVVTLLALAGGLFHRVAELVQVALGLLALS